MCEALFVCGGGPGLSVTAQYSRKFVAADKKNKWPYSSLSEMMDACELDKNATYVRSVDTDGSVIWKPLSQKSKKPKTKISRIKTRHL